MGAWRTLTIRSTVAAHCAGVMLRLAGERSSWQPAHLACQIGLLVSSGLASLGMTRPDTPAPDTSRVSAPLRFAPRISTSTLEPDLPPMGNRVVMWGICAAAGRMLTTEAQRHRDSTEK